MKSDSNVHFQFTYCRRVKVQWDQIAFCFWHWFWHLHALHFYARISYVVVRLEFIYTWCIFHSCYTACLVNLRLFIRMERIMECDRKMTSVKINKFFRMRNKYFSVLLRWINTWNCDKNLSPNFLCQYFKSNKSFLFLKFSLLIFFFWLFLRV